MNKCIANTSFKHFLIIIILTTAIYLPSLNGDFVYDDAETIVKNPYIKNLKYLPAYFDPRNSKMWSSHLDQRMFYRPITLVTFALNYNSSGLNPFSYHLVNLVIHILTTLAIYAVVYYTIRSFKEPFSKEMKNSISFIASLLFAIHPIQTESVAYVVSRSVIIGTLFLICSLITFVFALDVKEKKRQLINLFSWVFFALSLCSKEIGIVFPLLIFTYSFLHHKQANLIGCWKTGFIASLPYLIILAIYMVMRTVFMGGATLSVLISNLAIYFATAAKALFIYLRILIIPIGQNADHFLPLVKSVFEPWSVLAYIGLLLIGWLVFTHILSRSLFLSFWMLWYFLSLAPNLLLPTNEAISEHTVYFPSIGFFVTATYIIFVLWSRYGRIFGNVQKMAQIGIALAVIIQLSFLTLHRNIVWQNAITLWEDTVQKSPNKDRPHINLGLAYYNIGKFDKAIIEYKTALSINPNNYVALNALGIVYADKGELKNAESSFKRSILIKKENPDAYNNLGFLLILKKQYLASIPILKKALTLNPDSSLTLSNLGIALIKSGNLEKGCSYFKLAVSVNPDEKRGHTLFNELCKN